MERFREVFKNKHVVLPVIHVESPRQALLNIAVAKDAGADGVFLINHNISRSMLLDVYQLAVNKFPDFWIGVNLLGIGAFGAFETIFKKGLRVQGVWTDNAQIEEFKPISDQLKAQKVRQCILSEYWKGLYFGGVAFKYQQQVQNLDYVARIATHFMDVVTTSGPETGMPPSVEKVRLMKQAIKGRPLVIASGITPENVKDYPESDGFLVATGISDDFYTLNEGKIGRLLKNARQLSH
jgi:hypothetical protein